ncbi:MAG: glycosyltransferase [Chloroflexi bacterium]|nr:glycosyltransferase [Chloroflexota bacterium]
MSPDWLAPLVDVLERDPHAGMATPKIVLLNDPALVNTYGNDVHFTGFGYLRAWQEPASGLTHTQEVAAISGAAFIMRAETFRELGGFDELFFPAYAEDADLSWRARIAGYRLYAVPQSVIRHDYRLHFSPAKFEFLERNRLQMLFKNYRWPTLVVLTPALMLAEVVGWGFAAVSGRRYWSAKLRGYGWIIRHWRTLMQHRRTVQERAKRPTVTSCSSTSIGSVQAGRDGRGPDRRTHLQPAVLGAVSRFTRGRPVVAAMAMRVAHLTATFFPYPSGTGRVCLQNALGAAKLGCDVTVITSAVKDESVIDDPPGLTVHRLPAAFKVGNAPLLPGLFRMAKYDIVHLHYPFVFGQEILHAVAGLRRIPVVITYHQDLILSGMMGRMVALHEKTVGRLILTRANRLLVTSRDYFNASRIARFFKPDDPRVTEMPNGVDTSRFTTDVDTAGIRSMYGFAEDDVVLAFCGGMDTPHYFKGVDVLLNAAARVDAPNLRLMLIGDGDLRARYMEGSTPPRPR